MDRSAVDSRQDHCSRNSVHIHRSSGFRRGDCQRRRHRRDSSRSRSRSRNRRSRSRSRSRSPAASGAWRFVDDRLPCGLRHSEVSDLLDREITPEDYEMLLALDETIAKPAASTADVHGLLATSCPEGLADESCTVCLVPLGSGDSVAKLPCGHTFHHACISKWLSERSRTCPLCGCCAFSCK